MSEKNNPYANLEHRGKRDIQITDIQVDSLYLDASMTSLTGRWLMSNRGNKLFFSDTYAVGLSVYDLDGQYDTTYIRYGRGPNEMAAEIWISAFDESCNLIAIDANNAIHIYDSEIDIKTVFIPEPWFTLLDENFTTKDWDKLYRNPNPEIPQMYEYNNYVGKMAFEYDRAYIPITTEHVHYNLFDASGAKNCWRDAYIFISFEPQAIATTKKMFGHYPPVYRHKNIPVFGRYDFAFVNGLFYVTFNADPNIYVMDRGGNLLYSFGFSESGISGNYPSTKTFDEFDSQELAMRRQYGYYDHLYSDGEFLFRTCKLDDGNYKLQIYRNADMIGDCLLHRDMQIVGKGNDGFYYAFIRSDIENEQFVFTRFAIKLNQ